MTGTTAPVPSGRVLRCAFIQAPSYMCALSCLTCGRCTCFWQLVGQLYPSWSTSYPHENQYSKFIFLSRLKTPSVCFLRSFGLFCPLLRFYFLGSCWGVSSARRDRYLYNFFFLLSAGAGFGMSGHVDCCWGRGCSWHHAICSLWGKIAHVWWRMLIYHL